MPFHSSRLLCIAWISCSLWLFASPVEQVSAQPTQTAPAPEESVFNVTQPTQELQLIETTSRILQTPNRILRVDGFDPSVVKVTVLPQIANQIRVQAAAAGITSVVLTDETGSVFRVEVSVLGDVRQLESVLRRAFPDSNVKAVKVKDSVLLTGWINQPDQLTPIIEVAEQFHPKVLNYLKVAGVQQVLLRVKIMEVQRSKLRQFGFNFLYMGENGYLFNSVGQLVPLSRSTSSPLSLPFGGPPGVAVDASAIAQNTSAIFGITGSNALFQGFVDALRQEDLLKVLAEPNLVTINGRPAHFADGGEFPVPVPQSLGNFSIQWKETGVKLEFVPNVLSSGRVRLEVAPEVSEKDTTGGVTISGTSVPGIVTRKINTQVEMSFGETLILGGLISQRITSSTRKIPFLGDLPWVGAAFRRVRELDSEAELLIMVTPELAGALPPEQAMLLKGHGPGDASTTPSDKELFELGLIEVPKVGDECVNCAPSEFPEENPIPDDSFGGMPASRPGLIGPPGYEENPVPPEPSRIQIGPTETERLPATNEAGAEPAPETPAPPLETSTRRRPGMIRPVGGWYTPRTEKGKR